MVREEPLVGLQAGPKGKVGVSISESRMEKKTTYFVFVGAETSGTW